MTQVSLDTLIQRVRRPLLDEPYEDYLTADYVLDDGVLTVNNSMAWAEGDIAEMRDTTGEQFKVRVGGNNPIAVNPGHNDTAATGHLANTVILKNPRYSYAEISESIERACFEMWPEAWQVKQLSITPVAGQWNYPVTDDVEFPIRLTQDISTGANLNTFYYGQHAGYPMGLLHDVPSSISSTGLVLNVPVVYNGTNPLLLTYGTYIDVDTVEEGLMADCVVMGATVRMLGMRQIQRAGQDLRAAEPGAPTGFLQSLSYYQGEWQRLLRRLHLQLLETDPPASLWNR